MFGFRRVKSVNAEDFDKLIKEGYKLIDVRTPAEHSEARIEDSILADIYSPDFKKVVDNLNKEDNYLVYCRSGNRSKTACDFMMKWGFKSVIDLSGGIISWVNAGKEIIRN
jgi:rhodanese-related sulfurtransferase